MLRLLAQSIRSGKRRDRTVTIVDPKPYVLDRFRLLFPTATKAADTFEDYVSSSLAEGRVL